MAKVAKTTNVIEMIRKKPDVSDLPRLETAGAWHAKIAAQIEHARTALGSAERSSRRESARHRRPLHVLKIRITKVTHCQCSNELPSAWVCGCSSK